ncbi:MAG: hypothetical protein Fur003_2950 [Candidatus Dojkabacteria bacterium]
MKSKRLNLKLIRSLFLLLTLFVLLIPKVSEVYAADQLFSLTITPSINEITIKQGATYNGVIKIENRSEVNKPLPVEVAIFNYATSVYGTPVYKSTEEGARKWLALDKPSFILEAKESEELKYTLEVPKNAPSGSYFVALLFKPNPPADYFEPHSTPTLGYISGILIINVGDKGDLKEGKIEIKNFEKLDEKGQSYGVEIQNSSPYYKKVDSKITIYNLWNKKIDSSLLTGLSIMPNESRKYTQLLQKSLAYGYYKAILISDLQGDDKATPQMKEISFIVWPPVWFIVLFVVGVIFLSLIIYSLTKEHRARIKVILMNLKAKFKKLIKYLKKKVRNKS